jgi:hypothetical protein
MSRKGYDVSTGFCTGHLKLSTSHATTGRALATINDICCEVTLCSRSAPEDRHPNICHWNRRVVQWLSVAGLPTTFR